MEPIEGHNTKLFSGPEEFRKWLEQFHSSDSRIFLIFYKKDSENISITYSQALEEALCYGWVDSVPKKRNEESYYVLFSKRNPKSNWSRVNKEKVNKLMKQGKMTAPGMEMVEKAKTLGTWTALDEVDNLVVPGDLAFELEKYSGAKANWDKFPLSIRRGILEWIFNAKRPETRRKRIEETAKLAQENKRANQFNR